MTRNVLNLPVLVKTYADRSGSLEFLEGVSNEKMLYVSEVLVEGIPSGDGNSKSWLRSCVPVCHSGSSAQG